MESGIAAPPVASATQRSRIIRSSFIKHGVSGLILVTLLRLVSGRSDWYRAWIYAGLTLGFQVAVGLVLMRVNPDLLVERSKLQKGTKTWDKWLVGAMAGGPLVMWCVAAWDVRRHWPPVVSLAWSAAAFALCLLGLLLTSWAMLANRFFSATVRIQEERGHVVVDGGPYRYIRHPGYAGALLFSLATPVALGSWLALIPAALITLAGFARTALEDRTLCRELHGYQHYTSRVRYRLVPGLW